MKHKVIVLTMSSKYKGYCVAGIDTQNGEWIRLVSGDEEAHGALCEADVAYETGMRCKPLDIVEVDVLERIPHEYQPENALINEGIPLKKITEVTLSDLLELHPAERHSVILGNQWPYITEAAIGRVEYSLVLVEVTELRLVDAKSGKKKAFFRYNGISYENMSLTDPDFYSVQSGWSVPRALLVMSLPDSPFPENRYYKFVAKVFPLDA